MKKITLAGAAGVVAASLAMLVLPAGSAGAQQLPCDRHNQFVKVNYHTTWGKHETACYAGAGKNWFEGVKGSTSWMDYLWTGNNDITWVDCNGTRVDVPRWNQRNYRAARCIKELNIKPF
ncbi:beta/gamma crystallin domain-containing protein [Amycolatopsis sp. NPDC059027]|uniref:beta/gamma crystallin domain-containing protein n=1 Tax=unclassified Amycolatopsis TaxID=2618356 RepID=UPI0036711C58